MQQKPNDQVLTKWDLPINPGMPYLQWRLKALFPEKTGNLWKRKVNLRRSITKIITKIKKVTRVVPEVGPIVIMGNNF